MTERLEFTAYEQEETFLLYNRIKDLLGDSLHDGDERCMMNYIKRYLEQPEVHRDVFGLNPIVESLRTALTVVEEIGLPAVDEGSPSSLARNSVRWGPSM